MHKKMKLNLGHQMIRCIKEKLQISTLYYFMMTRTLISIDILLYNLLLCT